MFHSINFTSKLVRRIGIMLFLSLLISVPGSNVLAQDASANILNQAENFVNIDEDIKGSELGVGDNPRILPDSPFYFAKNIGRGIQSFFTFNPVSKAELKLKFASEKLIEAKKMAEKNSDNEKIVKALNNYQKEIERVKGETEKKNLKADNPRAEKFLETLVDRSLKQQRLLDKIEKRMPTESYLEIEKVKNGVLENFVDVSTKMASPEKLKEKIENVVQVQEGSRLKHIKNLEVLMRIEEKVPEQAKEAIKKAQANTLKRLKGDLEAIPEQEKPVLQEYLKKIGGNEIRHLEIISDLESEELSSADRKTMEAAKARVAERAEEKLRQLSGEAEKKEYLKRLEDGEIKRIRTIKELEENLAPETVSELIKIKNRVQDNLRKKIEAAETSEEKEKLLKEVEEVPNVRTLEILKEMEEIISPEKMEMLGEMKNKLAGEIEKEVNEAGSKDARARKLEAISSGLITAPQVVKELNLSAPILREIEAVEMEKIKRRIEATKDPQRLEMMRQKIEINKVPLSIQGVNILQEKTAEFVEKITSEKALERIKKAKNEVVMMEKITAKLPSVGREMIEKANRILTEADKNYQAKNYPEAYKNAISVLRLCAEIRELSEKDEMMENIKKVREKEFIKAFPGVSVPNVMICPIPKKPECRGEVIREKDARGCVIFKCKKVIETRPTSTEPDSSGGAACINQWAPVCGNDGKTYSNDCWAKAAGVDIKHKGACAIEQKPTSSNVQLRCAKEGERVNRNPLLGDVTQKCCSGLSEVMVSKSYSVCKKRDDVKVQMREKQSVNSQIQNIGKELIKTMEQKTIELKTTGIKGTKSE